MGTNQMQYITSYASPIGEITLASDGSCLIGLWLVGQRYFAATLVEPREEKALDVFSQTKLWLDIYFSGKRPDFMPPVALSGSPFRRVVWQELLDIPYGQTATYGEIAARVAAKTNAAKVAPRAVGGAVGRNPVSIIVPCHRVIGADGNLVGYAGGLKTKKYLLELEGVTVTASKNFSIGKVARDVFYLW